MTVDEIISKLDDHGFEDVDTADKVEIVNATIWDVCSREPWPFLETQVTVVADADGGSPENGEYSISTGEVNIADLNGVLTIVNTTSGDIVKWVRWDEHTQTHAQELTLTGDAYSYFFKGDKLFLYPVPQSGSYVVNYVKIPAEVVAGGSEASIVIPPRHHWVIVHGALTKLYFSDDDAEQSSGAETLFQMYLQTMRQDLWKKQWDRPDSILVMDDDLDYS